MTLGEKITNARKQANMSQEQLAEKLNVSRSAIAKWETDKGIPDIENLKALSGVFEVSIDYLVGNENDFKTKQDEPKSEDTFQRERIVKRNQRYQELIGKKCTIEMNDWNDGICEAYIVAQDDEFIFYYKKEKKKSLIGVLAKDYVKDINILNDKKKAVIDLENYRNINKDFFVGRKAYVALEEKHIWSGIFGEDIDFINANIERFCETELVVEAGTNFMSTVIPIEKLVKVECEMEN